MSDTDGAMAKFNDGGEEIGSMFGDVPDTGKDRSLLRACLGVCMRLACESVRLHGV